MITRVMRILAIPVVALVGCNGGEEITTYTTPRTEPPRSAVDYAAVAQQLDHTLAAILPQGERAWFFKLAGPAPAIERRRDDFLSFLKSIGPVPDKGATTTWKVPEGWEEKRPTSEFITTVLVVPDDAGPLELTVSSLELTGEWHDFVVKNVNRWLGQLSQAPLEPERIARLTKEVPTPAGRATVIELAGFNPKAARPSAEGGVADNSPAAKPPAAADLRQADGPLVYETPKGWQPGRAGGMRTAAFTIVDGRQQAEMTVIPLPTTAGPQVTDVTANVQRWAGQVGLLSPQVDELTEAASIGGAEGSYVALLGPEDAERPVGLLAAMVEHGDKVWFFKLTGDRALVKSQEGTFRKFLESVRFQ